MKITISDTQKSIKLNKLKIKKIIRAIFEKEKIETDEVIFHFVDEKTIKDLHIKHFNDPASTDCITLALDPLNEKKPYHVIGECFICTDEAIIFSKENNLDKFKEITLYIIHTILHLIGFDDIKKNDKLVMRKKENEILSYLEMKNILLK